MERLVSATWPASGQGPTQSKKGDFSMNIELFSAKCRLCDRTLGLLKQTFPSLQIIIHRQSECVAGSCCALAEKYGVRAVPSLVINGKIVMVGLPGEQEIKDLAKILEA